MKKLNTNQRKVINTLKVLGGTAEKEKVAELTKFDIEKVTKLLESLKKKRFVTNLTERGTQKWRLLYRLPKRTQTRH